MILSHAKYRSGILRSLPLLMAVLIVLTPPSATTQSGATPQSLPSSAAITQSKPILFEVVSIRIHKANIVFGKGFTPDGYDVSGEGLPSLLYSTYAAEDRARIEGMPDWASHEVYDIKAKVADADVAAWGKLDVKLRRLALQAMLADRFHLQLHHETREMPVYALVIAKGGSKLKEATPGDTYPNGFKGLGDSALLGVMMETQRGVIKGQAVPVDAIAQLISGGAGRPVINRTGLTGKYDVTLTTPPGPPPAATPNGDPSDPDGPSIFTLIQEQLGLKLEPATGPVPFVVIDHLEHPTEN